MTHKVVDALIRIGINQKYIHISFSGKKGYHIEIFFTKPVLNEHLKKVYETILNEIQYDLIPKVGMIELRPLPSNGVKIPLSLNFTNPDHSSNRCFYCKHESLELIKDINYILEIEKIETEVLIEILDVQSDRLFYDETLESGKCLIEMEQAIENHKQLKTYQHNQVESDTVDSIELLEQGGLSRPATRHNSLFKLCKYYRYLGLTPEGNIEELIGWMRKQDPKSYTSKWDEVLKDIRGIVEYIYEKEVSLTVPQKDISVNLQEVQSIIKAESKNQKLLLYALLIHSKRYAGENGVFYMTSFQMENATELDEKTCRRLIKDLENQGFIEVVQRNISQKGTHLKKPNKYKMTIGLEEMRGSEESVYFLNDSQGDYTHSFVGCITHFFDKKTLKRTLPRRQFEFFRDYRLSESIQYSTA